MLIDCVKLDVNHSDGDDDFHLAESCDCTEGNTSVLNAPECSTRFVLDVLSLGKPASPWIGLAFVLGALVPDRIQHMKQRETTGQITLTSCVRQNI